MNPIGQKVLSVGRSQATQRGLIYAFAYQWGQWQNSQLLSNRTYSRRMETFYTDYLIASEDGRYFSQPGDSGKLIVTDDDKLQPIALLWGGWQERRRSE